MTKEEMKQEAEKYFKNLDECKTKEMMIDAYITGAELERKLEQTEKDLADYQFNYPTIKELQKENAELKDDNKVMADNLTKAKEIIRELLNSCFGYNSKTVNYEVKVKAEKFLKEV